MDQTLIKVNSGSKFPINESDWKFYDKNLVPKKLKELDKDGFRLGIITNQKGISLGLNTKESITNKIEQITEILNLPFQAFIAMNDDIYRKPLPGIWTFLCHYFSNGVHPKLEESFFVGDGAGRPKNMTRFKDHTDADIKFAKNVGLKFQTPEKFFLGEKDLDLPDLTLANPAIKFMANQKLFVEDEVLDFKSDEKIMVIMVGSPGSGKSTFTKNYLQNYERVNNDDNKGNAKKSFCLAENLVKAGKPLVIDNTNRDKKMRGQYIHQAKKHKYLVYCLNFKLEKDLAMYFDNLRQMKFLRNHMSKKAGSIAIHTFYKNYEEPEYTEEFDEIRTVNPVMKFESTEEQTFFQLFI